VADLEFTVDQPQSKEFEEEEGDARLRAALAHYGAPLFVPKDVLLREMPTLEVTLAQGLRLAHRDPAVAGNIPVVLWRNRQLDVSELVRLAVWEGEGQTLGFFLELTDQLADGNLFTPFAEPLHGERPRRMKNFFSADGGLNAYERPLAVMNTPAVAKRWRFLMNMSLDSFTGYFRKGTRPSVRLAHG
jgi:hypothetical protein